MKSPIRLRAVVDPGDDGKVWLDLIGEDGRFIKKESLDYSKYSTSSNIWINPSIDFQINGAAEYARLMLTSYDTARRRISVNSVDLILLKLGDDDINPALNPKEAYAIREPVERQVVRGGLVSVYALIRPVNKLEVIFELINLENKTVGSLRLVVPPPPTGSTHTPVQIALPYEVDKNTNVRLVIRQESDTRLPGDIALSSVQLYVEP